MIERRYEENDLQSLLELLRSSYGGWHDIHYWAWKYERNPHGSPVVWVAEDEGRIVGCYILNPVKIRIGPVLVKGAQSVDAAVDNAYRGAGIFKRLAVSAIAQAAREGVALIYAFPTEIAHKGQVRIGYRPMFIVPKMFKVLDAHSLLEEQGFKSSFLQKTLSIMQAFQKISNVKISTRYDYELKARRIKTFDPRFETFWDEIKEENKNILIERDLAYLKWRYIEHPEKQYTTYVCEKNGKVVGYIVLSVEKNASMETGKTGRLTVGNIIDLSALPNMINAAYPLVSAACEFFEHERVDIARCWMVAWHPYHAILREFGFSESYELLRRAAFRPKYNAQLICYVNSRATIQEAIRSMPTKRKLCWFITQGDADYT